jgi:pimeloyl-ACP methyl ester carboxylesterase
LKDYNKRKMKTLKTTTRASFKKILSLSLGVLIALTAASCHNDDDKVLTSTNMVDVGGYNLFTESLGEGNHTLVFESGLGDNYESWYQLLSLSESNQVIAYNRAGYAPSEVANNDRIISQLADELHQVITSKSKNDRVILVGHSLGGAVIRYYAVQHPEKVEGLLFVDPSHEDYGEMTQGQEDDMVGFFTSEGQEHIASEAEQMIENFQSLKLLASLPNVPTIVLTSIKHREGEDATNWINAHATLGDGITDFTHITTENSGHYIQIMEPQLVLDAIHALLN